MRPVELASRQSEGFLGQDRPVFIVDRHRLGHPAEPSEGEAIANVDRRIPEAGRHSDVRILGVALSKQTSQRFARLREQLRRLPEKGHVVMDRVARHTPEHREEQMVDGVLDIPRHRVTKQIAIALVQPTIRPAPFDCEISGELCKALWCVGAEDQPCQPFEPVGRHVSKKSKLRRDDRSMFGTVGSLDSKRVFKKR